MPFPVKAGVGGEYRDPVTVFELHLEEMLIVKHQLGAGFLLGS